MMSDDDRKLCGPWEGTLNELIPQVPGEACPEHDACYTESGVSRDDCDLAFERDLARASKGNPVLQVIGAVYAAAVRLFGWLFYRRRGG